MLRSQAALCAATGSFEMSVFQMLSAGNIGQFGAPGTVVPGTWRWLTLTGLADAAFGNGPRRAVPAAGRCRCAACRPLAWIWLLAGAGAAAAPQPATAATDAKAISRRNALERSRRCIGLMLAQGLPWCGANGRLSPGRPAASGPQPAAGIMAGRGPGAGLLAGQPGCLRRRGWRKIRESIRPWESSMKVPLTIADFLRRGAHVYGDRPALIDEPGTAGTLGTITYRSLERRARGVAIALDRMGVGHGERVAVVSPNAARFGVLFYGVSAHGRVLVPINYRLNTDEVGYIVGHSGASVLLVDPESDEALRDVKAPHRIVLDGVADSELFAEAADDAEPARWEPDEDATASINYTSGTTARPKGVQLTHRNCWLNAVAFGWHASVTDRDVYLHTLPMFHCNGWGMPYAVTAMGIPQVVVRKIDGAELLRRIDEHGVTLLCGAPAVVAALLDAAGALRSAGQPVPGRDRVRMIVAGAPPPSKAIERVESELGWEFIQIYGLTETAPLLTINRRPAEWDSLPAADRARLQSRAGAPAIGVQVDAGSSGEVLARSNHVFAGYWRQPDESAKVVVDGWFHTGDEGYIDPDEYLTISDRKKDVIISGGENVSSVEVEDCLYQHPAVAEAAVIGVPDERWGETVKALVVARSGHQVSEAELIEFCRSKLAHYKCPTSVEMREALARTATGKLQKFKLRGPYWEGYERRVH